MKKYEKLFVKKAKLVIVFGDVNSTLPPLTAKDQNQGCACKNLAWML